MPFPAPFGTPVAVNGILPSATVNEIAVDITKTINAVDGDTLTPTNPIVVDSGVVQFANTSTLDVESLLTLTAPGVANLSGSLNVYGNTTFDATTVSVSGTTAVSVGGSTTTTCINGWIGTFQAGTIQNLSGAWNLKTGATATHESGSATAFATGSTVSLGASVNLATNTRTYTRPCRPNALYVATEWSAPGLGAPAQAYYTASTNAASTILQFDPDLPNTCTVTGLAMYVTPGVHVNVPAQPPTIELWSLNIATGATNKEASVTDATAVPAYNSRHQFSVTGLSVAIDGSTYSYYLLVRGELGANSLPGGLYEIPTITWTRAKIGEER